MTMVKEKEGFTLIEALLYITLTSIVLYGAVLIFYQLGSENVYLENETESNAEALFVMQKIDSLLDSGVSISASSSIIADEPIEVRDFKMASNTISFSIGNNLFNFSHY